MLALAVAPWAFVGPAAADSASGAPGNHKVTICHRTNSDTNPYVVITVDTDAAGGGKDTGAGDHAAEHRGPLWSGTLKSQHIEWGDIIPPYLDDQGVAFPGYNWTAAGQAIYANHCAGVTPPRTTTPPATTTTPPATTTTPPATTTTTKTTTTPPATTTRATTTTPATGTVTTTTTRTSTAVVTTAGGSSVLPTSASTSPASTTAGTAVLGEKVSSLPRTGGRLSVTAALALSLLLILAGSALLGWRRLLAPHPPRRH